jgi:hypothetical protein
MFSSALATESKNGMGMHLKEIVRNPLRQMPNLTLCPSSPAAREPISVVIPSDLPRKRRVMLKDVNASNARERWTRW